VKLFFLAAPAFVLPACVCAQCPVTTPAKLPFVPPPPYRTNMAGGFYYGSESLWTWIPNDPLWWAGGEKVVYWRAGFDARKEPQPDLKIVARRLDAQAPLVWALRTSAVWFPENQVTHFDAPEDMAMMSGIDLSQAAPVAASAAGSCWEISAHYANAAQTEVRTLTFVVRGP
jgi:hypothetical protein